MDETEIDNIIDLFAMYYREIAVQTRDEHEGDLNSDADIPYENFLKYLEIAEDELEAILVARGIALTDVQRRLAYCHIVADHYEMGNPDWSFKSESMGSGISFSRGDDTGPRAALNKLLDQVEQSTMRGSLPSAGPRALLRTKDHTNYPRRYKLTQIPAFDYSESGFDSSQTSDY